MNKTFIIEFYPRPDEDASREVIEFQAEELLFGFAGLTEDKSIIGCPRKVFVKDIIIITIK